ASAAVPAFRHEPGRHQADRALAFRARGAAQSGQMERGPVPEGRGRKGRFAAAIENPGPMRLSLKAACAAACVLGLLAGCVFVRTGLSDEERQRLQAPDKAVVAYAAENLDAAQSYVDGFDERGLQVGKRISGCMRDRASAVGVLDPDRIRVVVQD